MIAICEEGCMACWGVLRLYSLSRLFPKVEVVQWLVSSFCSLLCLYYYLYVRTAMVATVR